MGVNGSGLGSRDLSGEPGTEGSAGSSFPHALLEDACLKSCSRHGLACTFPISVTAKKEERGLSSSSSSSPRPATLALGLAPAVGRMASLLL
mmetsp:Transcript_89802/g.257304  ORF Transcript_89802/g.257304 Transcript_89802/m.257304 type:complete len:92 (-) Transcript_89802:1132-1407(-)